MRASFLTPLAVLLAACAAVRAPPSSSPDPVARVSVRSPEPGVRVELRTAESGEAARCVVPCNLLSAPGPAELIVRKGNDASARTVVLANGDQTMRVRPGNRIARGAGWASIAASMLAFSVFAVTYGTSVQTSHEQATPASGSATGDTSSHDGAWKNSWAEPVVVGSVTAVIPLLLTGLLLLDHGTAGVSFEQP